MRARRRVGPALVPTLAGLLLLLGSAVGPSTAVYPTLPSSLYSGFLSGLAVPVAAPGSTVTLTGTLADPATFGTISDANLTIGLYAFSGYPGNDTGPLPMAGSPSFVDATSGTTVVTVAIGTLGSGTMRGISEPIVVPSGAAAGAYAIRFQLSFVENGSPYLFESRGYFSYESWTNATQAPNGTTVLNVSRLGVSGVLPETALPVVSNPYPWVLALLLAAAVGCAAAGGYYAARRGPGSRSGANSGREASNAPSARGKRRTSDGD